MGSELLWRFSLPAHHPCVNYDFNFQLSQASNSFLWHLLKCLHIKPLSVQPLSARSGAHELWAKDDLCTYCLLLRSTEGLVITTFEKSGLQARHVSSSGPLRKRSWLHRELTCPLRTLWCSQEKQKKIHWKLKYKKCYLGKLQLKKKLKCYQSGLIN